MEYAISIVAAAPVRKEPNHRSEMVNQLLFGERMQVLEANEEWLRIRSLYDGYEGWLTQHLIKQIDAKVATQQCNYITASIINTVGFSDQQILIPMGSEMVGFNENTGLLWQSDYRYSGEYRNISDPLNKEMLSKFIHGWINAPYLWGGKTIMGVDCSGFVQTVFKVLGLKLKRDAWQQAEQGSAVENISEAKQGDLGFFHNEKGRVTHVGIVLDGNRIAHSSGKVRIDQFDENGIQNMETNKRTHRLHSIRSIL
jgi:cell wall-associated NlpC family hydrolase